MIVQQEWYLTDEAAKAFEPSVVRANFGWPEFFEWLASPSGCIWNIGNQGWVFTIVNEADELEILLCGGRDSKACAQAFEQAAIAHPAHKGMTMRLEGRPAWRRIFKHWNCDANGVLTRAIEG